LAVLLTPGFPEGDTILYTSCNEKGTPTGTDTFVTIGGAEVGPVGTKVNEPRDTDPFGGATPLVGSKNVVNVAFHPVLRRLLVRPVVNSTFGTNEIRSRSVKDTM
jgi:hypothetical protein